MKVGHAPLASCSALLTFSQVYLSAIKGHVPSDIVRAFRALLEFCYIARRNVLDESMLRELDAALSRFHQYRTIFQTSGVRPTGFSLPRQHSLIHYHQMIRLYGTPNGLCSSITESRHITAVKETWRRSNKFNALGQMLITNQRLDKLAAARVHFANCGMLQGTCLSQAISQLGEQSLFFDRILIHQIQMRAPMMKRTRMTTMQWSLLSLKVLMKIQMVQSTQNGFLPTSKWGGVFVRLVMVCLDRHLH